MPKIFAQAEHEVSLQIEAQSTKAVVWIGARGVHGDHIFHEIGFAIAGAILGSENTATFGEVYPVIGTDTGIHAHV